jgi:hypothetical protein
MFERKAGDNTNGLQNQKQIFDSVKSTLPSDPMTLSPTTLGIMTKLRQSAKRQSATFYAVMLSVIILNAVAPAMRQPSSLFKILLSLKSKLNHSSLEIQTCFIKLFHFYQVVVN